jgi:hypothetical protein
MTWQHRITRVLVRERDLFGQWANRWRVIRTSNAYVFRDPLASKSEIPSGTRDQDTSPVPSAVLAAARDPDSPLERALARFGVAVAAKEGC